MWPSARPRGFQVEAAPEALPLFRRETSGQASGGLRSPPIWAFGIRALWVLCFVLQTISAGFCETPQLQRLSDGSLVLEDLPPILDEAEVDRHLNTGLTTALAFSIEPVGNGQTMSASVQIRYELWDELYLVTVLQIDGTVLESSLPTREKLSEWWSRLQLPIAASAAANSTRAKVTLDVVPFSHSEQIETQRWFAESVRRAEQTSESDSPQLTREPTGSVEKVFDILIATSIRRRSIARSRWILEIQEARPP